MRVASKSALTAAETLSNIEVPEPALDHLTKLTDDTGLFQHAKFTIPNRATATAQMTTRGASWL